jgi:hypothetical protein
MALTDTSIKQAKPAATPFKLTDEKGLHLLVHPSGSKYWRLNYRFDGKQKTLALGVYPDTSLKQARIYRDEARQLIASGTDPGELRKAEKEATAKTKQDAETAAEVGRLLQAGEAIPDSFRAIGIEWSTKYLTDKSPKYRQKVLNRLDVEVYPYLGNLPVTQLTAPPDSRSATPH